jgi:hypothetical protein
MRAQRGFNHAKRLLPEVILCRTFREEPLARRCVSLTEPSNNQPIPLHEVPETPPNALGRGSRLATTHDFASGAEFPQALEAQARAFATTNHGFAVCRWRLLGVRSLVT